MNWITNRKSTSRSRISRKSSKVFFECVRNGSHKTATNVVRRPRYVSDNRSRDLVHLDCVVNTKRSSRDVYSGSEINTGTSGLMPCRARNKSDGNPRNYGEALHLPNASAVIEHPTLDIAGTTDEASKGLFPEISRLDFDIHRIRRRHFDRQPSHHSTPIDQFPEQIPRNGLSSERQRGSGFGNFNVHRLHEPWSSSQQSSRDSHLSRQGSRDFTSFDEPRQFPTLAGMDFQQKFGVPTTGTFQSCNQSNFSLENELYNNTREHPDSPRSFGIQTQTFHNLPSMDQQTQTDCSELLVDGGRDMSADTPVTSQGVCSKKRRSARFKKNATL